MADHDEPRTIRIQIDQEAFVLADLERHAGAAVSEVVFAVKQGRNGTSDEPGADGPILVEHRARRPTPGRGSATLTASFHGRSCEAGVPVP